MGTGARVFFVEDDDRLTHISLKRWEDLVRNGEEAKPLLQYAGQKIRCVLVVLRVENRKPVKIIGLECNYLHFNKEGYCSMTVYTNLCIGSVLYFRQAVEPGSIRKKSNHKSLRFQYERK